MAGGNYLCLCQKLETSYQEPEASRYLTTGFFFLNDNWTLQRRHFLVKTVFRVFISAEPIARLIGYNSAVLNNHQHSILVVCDGLFRCLVVQKVFSMALAIEGSQNSGGHWFASGPPLFFDSSIKACPVTRYVADSMDCPLNSVLLVLVGGPRLIWRIPVAVGLQQPSHLK